MPASLAAAQAVDLLHALAARIRWQQRLLCSLPVDARVDMDETEAQGLYLIFEDIYSAITEAVRLLDTA